MWSNIFKTSWRNLLRNKTYSLLNIGGLAIGMACCIFILLFVDSELRYDRHHEHADRIVRVAETFTDEGKVVEESASIPFPVGPTLAQAFPEVKQVRFYKTFEKIPLLSYGEKRFYEDKLLFTDSTVFDIFSFPMVQGNPAKALTNPFSIVLTEKMAAKYFGTENPMGKSLRFENQIDFTVTGVIRDLPVTSHIQFDFLASLRNIGDLFRASGTTFTWRGWYWNPCHTYLLLPPEMTREQLQAQLPDFVNKHTPEQMRSQLSFYLQPLTAIHLHSKLYQEIGVNGSERSVYLFALIAVFVLLIACINFMNLATARSVRRAKEIAVRKVVGAMRNQLIRQFIAESLLISFIAAILAFVLVVTLLPFFTHISGTTLDLALIGYPKLLAGTVVLALIVGLIAGSYPAFFLSSYKPVECFNLKSSAPTSAGSIFFRKGLVVFQFCISIALLIGTAVIHRQHRFLQEKELGFDREQLVMIPIRGTSLKPRVGSFLERLEQEPGVLHSSAISNIVGRDVQVCPFVVEGQEQPVQMPGLFVDFNFIKTFDVELANGRAFDRNFPTDSSAFLINEAAAAAMGWDEPIGKRMQFDDENGQGQVIGVVKDFNFANLHERIRPLAIKLDPSWFSYVAVRLAPGDISATLQKLSVAWREFEADRPFEAFFLDENLNQLYLQEKRLSSIFSAFAVLAIIIGCLGLFGLATFAAEQRTKEIGIRRVLGASVANIVGLLSRDFLSLVGIAFVIATPLAWYGMNRWLRDFPYRIEPGWWIFLAAGLAAAAIALLTVSFRSVKAALANPVKSLRSD